MNYSTQSLHFPKSKYSLEDVHNYLIQNKYKYNKIDVTNDFIRARQYDPRYLRKKGYNQTKVLVNKKSLIQRVIFYF
jgi:hypothetical protein